MRSPPGSPGSSAPLSLKLLLTQPLTSSSAARRCLEKELLPLITQIRQSVSIPHNNTDTGCSK
jgi:hypothetical protein